MLALVGCRGAGPFCSAEAPDLGPRSPYDLGRSRICASGRVGSLRASRPDRWPQRTNLQEAAQASARRRQRRTLLLLGSLPRGSRKKLDECPKDNIDGLVRVVWHGCRRLFRIVELAESDVAVGQVSNDLQFPAKRFDQPSQGTDLHIAPAGLLLRTGESGRQEQPPLGWRDHRSRFCLYNR